MKYIFYYEVLNGNNYKNIDLLVGKTKKAYLIGPKITDSFDYDSFIKRINVSPTNKIVIFSFAFHILSHIQTDTFHNR